MHWFLPDVATVPLSQSSGNLNQIITITVFDNVVYRKKLPLKVVNTIHFSFFDVTPPADGNGLIKITY